MQDDRAKAVAPPDSSALDLLRQELDVIQLLHHHNKNQHRGAIWYKYVKLLKSSLTRILSLAAVRQASANDVLKKQHSAEHIESKALYENEVLGFLHRHQSMYIGFTQIIGTGQYVALGMILLGVLARSWQIIQGMVTTHESDDDAVLEQVDTRLVASDSADDEGIVVQRASQGIATESSGVHQESSRKDSGRETVSGQRSAMLSASESVLSISTDVSAERDAPSAKKRKKKKVKHADEIDSIFG